MLRRLIKRTIGSAALAPFARGQTRQSLLHRVNVVYLHYVGEDRPYYSDFYLGTTLDQLDDDLRRLKEHFAFCSLAQVVGATTEIELDGKPLLALTFDDGFDLVRNGAIEVLDAHGVSATTFVVTSTLDNANLMWRNKLSAIRALCPESVLVGHYNALMMKAGLPVAQSGRAAMHASESWPTNRKEELVDQLWAACGMPPLAEFLDQHRPYFTREELRQWLTRGHGVGLHTHSHPRCSELLGEAVMAEIVEPGLSLKQELDLDFLPLSYPFGVRLKPEIELDLWEQGLFDCVFGIGGFAPRGTPPLRLERACMEGDYRYEVFGRAFVGRPRATATKLPPGRPVSAPKRDRPSESRPLGAAREDPEIPGPRARCRSVR